MSHDGSSCKSYIKHPTEKERLDNLAFTSFPEDYLPYASSYHHGGRGNGKAPPYLVWDERQPRKSRSRRRSCCSTAALVSAITLIVAAILVVVAISVYLGVVTNLFRSPVLSLSGKFRVSEGDEFSDELLNSTSYQFLYKAETYQTMVENVFLSSSLEPAFIAARIHSFRPGMLVFFRVYLDRRKMKQDDSSTMQLVKNLFKSDTLAFGALTIDRESVAVDENEEWVSVPVKLEHRNLKASQTASPPVTKKLPTRIPHPKLATAPNNKVTPMTRRISRPITSSTPKVTPASRTPEPDSNRSRTGTGEAVPVAVINSEDDPFRFSYGQWKPVPIEDSVSPSFRDQRTPPGRGSSRRLDELPNPPNRVSLSTGVGNRPPLGVGLVNKPSRTSPVGIGPVNQPSRPFSNAGGGNQSFQPTNVGEVNLPASNPLHVGVGSVSVLEDALTHMDPAPIPIRNNRPLRPLISDSYQAGEVASSIMSSVSLVVNPSQRNRTSSLDKNKLEMAKPKVEDEHPYRHPIQDPNTDRNDHASYRFLDDDRDIKEKMPLSEPEVFERGDVFVGTVETSSDNQFSDRISTDSGVIKKTDTVRNELKESSIEYLEPVEDGSTTETFNKSDIFTSEESSPTTLLLNDSNSSTEIVTGVPSHSEVSVPHNEGDVNNENSSYLLNYRMESDSIESSTLLSNVSDKTLQMFNDQPPIDKNSEFKDMKSSQEVTSTDETNTEDEIKIVQEINSSTRGEIFTSIIDEMNGGFHLSKTSTVIYSESELNGSSLGLGYTKDQPTTLDPLSMNKESIEKLLPDAISIHSQEGHGFYMPLFFKNKSSVEYSTLEPVGENESKPVGENESSVISETTTDLSYISTGDVVLEHTESLGQLEMSNKSYEEEFIELEGSTELISDMQRPDHKAQTSTGIPASPETTTGSFTASDPPEIDSTINVSEVSNTEQTSEVRTAVSSSTYTETETETEEVSTPLVSNNSEIASPGDTNDTEIISAGVGKIVPQLSDLSFNPNDIESDDKNFIGQDDDLDILDNIPADDEDQKDGEIIRHITTVPPTVPSFVVSLGKHPVFIPDSCLDDEMKCRSGECVDASSRCNMRRDCRDNSDEKNCPCADLLKIMGQSQKICDGVADCLDHSDEQNCSWCEEGQVVCSQTKFCINSSQVCDGHNDCPLGTDERYCVKLAESIPDAEGVHYRPNGYLMVRKEGKWGKLCLDNLQNSETLRTKLEDLGQAVCSALTYKNLSESSRISDTDDSNDSYYAISNEISNQDKRSSAIFQPSTCQSKAVMSVKCGSLACGLRPLATSNRRRIVGGASAGSGSWPWQVALYKEGDFQCGAVLVSDIWLISAGHCFYSTQTAYWIARLGLLRRGSELPSPSEQIRRINRIILHPDYIDKGFINDIAMLRMDRPVLFSDYLRPVCLPLENEDASLWHGKQCSVVGWGKLYEIGHTFPDSLQEVRLPVIATEECRKKIIFLTMYHITDNMFCAGYERGGRDACLGDSGGPLMCQRDDGRWILLGVTSNGDGCGRPGRPGVYTKVARYLGWIKQIIETRDLILPPADSCEGVRCNLGRCIPSYKMCDTRWDCSEGIDEDGCLD